MIEFFVDCLFHILCGWIANLVVRVITLGKVNLEWGSCSESIVPETIGVIFLLLLGVTLFWTLR
jgi:hypothetical protein